MLLGVVLEPVSDFSRKAKLQFDLVFHHLSIAITFEAN
jgi:hypothetical protein